MHIQKFGENPLIFAQVIHLETKIWMDRLMEIRMYNRRTDRHTDDLHDTTIPCHYRAAWIFFLILDENIMLWVLISSASKSTHNLCFHGKILFSSVCIEVLRPSQPNGSRRAWSVYLTTSLLGRLSPQSGNQYCAHWVDWAVKC